MSSTQIAISLLLGKSELLHRCLVEQQTCVLPQEKEQLFLVRRVYFPSLSVMSLMMKKPLKKIRDLMPEERNAKYRKENLGKICTLADSQSARDDGF